MRLLCAAGCCHDSRKGTPVTADLATAVHAGLVSLSTCGQIAGKCQSLHRSGHVHLRAVNNLCLLRTTCENDERTSCERSINVNKLASSGSAAVCMDKFPPSPPLCTLSAILVTFFVLGANTRRPLELPSESLCFDLARATTMQALRTRATTISGWLGQECVRRRPASRHDDVHPVTHAALSFAAICRLPC